MDDFEVELKNGFLEEAQQGVADVEQCFLALEANPSDAENLNKIFRLAHNLKGSSKAVGFDDLGSLTHEFETFILKVKNGEMPASLKVVNLFLRVNDFILTMIEGLRADFSASFDGATLINEMKNFSEESGEATADMSALALDEVSADLLETYDSIRPDELPPEGASSTEVVEQMTALLAENAMAAHPAPGS